MIKAAPARANALTSAAARAKTITAAAQAEAVTSSMPAQARAITPATTQIKTITAAVAQGDALTAMAIRTATGPEAHPGPALA